MAKIELSITTDYVNTWDAWSGVRELVQNAKDAEVQFNAPMTIDWHNGKLRIQNDNVTLPRESLLLGFSTKRDRDDLIGAFGEGYKIGVLALLRCGHAVKIRSGDEVWVPSIQKSEKYSADVLTFDIKGGNEKKNRIRVEVDGVTKEVWLEMKSRFLFLNDLSSSRIQTADGELLLSKEHQTKIFVKGIFVQSNSKLKYGYNFVDARLDRDRKMLNSWELDWKTALIWEGAVRTRPDMLETLFTLAQEDEHDVKGFADQSEVSKSLSGEVAKIFRGKHGQNAIPVISTSQSRDVEQYGARGVIVQKSLNQILVSTMGTADEAVKKLQAQVTKTLAWHELSLEQQRVLDGAIRLLGKHLPECSLNMIDVVKFNNPNMCGRFSEGRVLVSDTILYDFEETLATLIHEFAHQHGGDGERSHVTAIEKTWCAVVKELRAGVAA